MANPEQITLSGLQRAGTVIRKWHNYADATVPVRTASQELHGCSGLLDELAADLREEFPTLRTYARWGPSVYCWKYSEQRRVNGLAVGFWRDRGTKYRSFNWGFEFDIARPRDRWHISRNIGDEELVQGFALRPYANAGVLDRERMLHRLREYARKWRV